jgi:4-amino-4-deoxy-L-arabinose transferase-like glycosyltransferase
VHSDRAKITIAAVVIAAVAVFHFLTIRPGHYWGDDFAQYILHARNIAEGAPYGDTGYIYNPRYSNLSPRTYPPVYPLILAPIIRWGGVNLEAMKIETMLFFPAALCVIFLLFRRELRFRHSVALIAMLGFSPFLWDFKEEICSEIPFLFFLYLAFLGVRQATDAEASRRRQLVWTLVAGLAGSLGCGTRTLGILLVPSLLISDMAIHRKPTRLAATVTLMCGLWVIFQIGFAGGDASYFDQYAGWSPRVILNNSVYAASLAYFWANGYSKAVAGLLCLVFCVLAVRGYAARARERVTSFEAFLILYLTAIVSWRGLGGLRYLIPVLPLILFYSFVGLQNIRFPGRARMEPLVFGVLMAVVFLSYAARYSTMDFKLQAPGIHTESAREFFKFITEQTARDDVFAFAKPKALVLFTGRHAAACHAARDDSDLWDYFQEIGASYVALGPMDDEPLRLLVEEHGDRFDPVYSNADFRIYRIKERPPPKKAPPVIPG